MSRIDPCNECGFPSPEGFCVNCYDPCDDLPGIPLVLTILVSAITIVAVFFVAIGKFAN